MSGSPQETGKSWDLAAGPEGELLRKKGTVE